MPVLRNTITFTVLGNLLIPSITDAGIQGENGAIKLHVDLPADWQDLTCKLRVTALNGDYDEGVPIGTSIDLPLYHSVSAYGRLNTTLSGRASGIRKTLSCHTLMVQQSKIT